MKAIIILISLGFFSSSVFAGSDSINCSSPSGHLSVSYDQMTYQGKKQDVSIESDGMINGVHGKDKEEYTLTGIGNPTVLLHKEWSSCRDFGERVFTQEFTLKKKAIALEKVYLLCREAYATTTGGLNCADEKGY